MFNLRAYGIVINNNQVLLSNEFIKGHEIIKFPGGGLQWGEGLADCVKREFNEEFNAEVLVGPCFYVTDNFVPSAFDSTQQVISVYFLTQLCNIQTLSLEKITNTGEGAAQWHQLQWRSLSDLHEEMFYFPIDKKVAALIKSQLAK